MTFKEFVEQLTAEAPEGVTFRFAGETRAEFLYSDNWGFKSVISLDTDSLSGTPLEVSIQSYGSATETFLNLSLCAWLGRVQILSTDIN